MGVLPPYDRRREPRKPVDLSLMVWGVDTQGERFLQEAHARDISLSGALLSGLNADLKFFDVIGILYGKKKARYRVVWVRYDEMGDKMQAVRSPTGVGRLSVAGFVDRGCVTDFPADQSSDSMTPATPTRSTPSWRSRIPGCRPFPALVRDPRLSLRQRECAGPMPPSC